MDNKLMSMCIGHLKNNLEFSRLLLRDFLQDRGGVPEQRLSLELAQMKEVCLVMSKEIETLSLKSAKGKGTNK